MCDSGGGLREVTSRTLVSSSVSSASSQSGRWITLPTSAAVVTREEVVAAVDRAKRTLHERLQQDEYDAAASSPTLLENLNNIKNAIQRPFQHVFNVDTLAPLVAQYAVSGFIFWAVVEFNKFVWNRFTVRLELASNDDAHRWVNEWLAAQRYTQTCRHLEVGVERSRVTEFKLPGEQVSAANALNSFEALTDPNAFLPEELEQLGKDSSGDDRVARVLPRVSVRPAFGRHVLWWRGAPIVIERLSQSNDVDGVPGPRRKAQSSIGGAIAITTFGFGLRARQRALQLVREAMLLSQERDRGHTIVHVADQYGNWVRSSARRVRPLESVVLPEGLKSGLVRDATEFFNNEQWYTDRGIPFRRGYLLHGPPGTGKTSFITALAGSLDVNIYVIHLASKSLSDEMLVDLMSVTAERCIMLLEDVDAAFQHASAGLSGGGGDTGDSSSDVGADEFKSGSRVTMAGLLNAIDGVSSQEGRILFMTTNHIDRLSPALIRPGRVDVRAHFGLADESQLVRIFRRFFPDSEPSLAQVFASNARDAKVSMARVQGFLLRYRRQPEAAARHSSQLCNDFDEMSGHEVIDEGSGRDSGSTSPATPSSDSDS